MMFFFFFFPMANKEPLRVLKMLELQTLNSLITHTRAQVSPL